VHADWLYRNNGDSSITYAAEEAVMCTVLKSSENDKAISGVDAFFIICIGGERHWRQGGAGGVYL